MPLLLAALGGLLLNIAGSIAGRVLLALGIGLVTYTGLEASTGYLEDMAMSAFNQMGSTVIGLLGVLRVGESFSMVTSAIAVRLFVSGVTSGTFKRWVHK